MPFTLSRCNVLQRFGFLQNAKLGSETELFYTVIYTLSRLSDRLRNLETTLRQP